MIKFKDIDSLADLRRAKRELKLEMERQDQITKNGFLFSTVNNLVSRVQDTSGVLHSPIGEGVNTSLNFLSNQAKSRFKLGKTGEALISAAIVIAVPFIAKKIQDYVDKKF